MREAEAPNGSTVRVISPMEDGKGMGD